MARKKTPEKRAAIISTAKRLFASGGFENTSMQMLAREVGVPVGSVYTYFPSKQALLISIIDEGWAEFSVMIEQGIATAAQKADSCEPRGNSELFKLSFLVKTALPWLFEDVDLIAILFAQAGKSSNLGEKLDQLSGMVTSIVIAYQESVGTGQRLDATETKTGLAILLLGSLESVRLSYHADIDISAAEVIAFLVSTVEDALGCSLSDL
ncbi:MAG: TetR/AcrR family transcriptional regulator [Spirochaetaceae bacterium]|nr:TetR/AcrR family transcriptional regulator [Spirochaetaceae bacterium]